MYYLVGFLRYDYDLLHILFKSVIYKEVFNKMKDYKIGDTYFNLAILSDIFDITK